MSYIGKYRGIISDVNDPLRLGRVRARVPDVLGGRESGWALPCLPFAGQGMGFVATPKVGANVWIEFEHGDPEYPIWSGCFYTAQTEVPANALVPPAPKALLRTATGNTVLLDDTPGVGGIQLKAQSGECLKLSSQGLELFDATGKKVFSVGPLGLEFRGVAGQKLSVHPSELLLALAAGQKVSLSPMGVNAETGQGASIAMQGPKVSINGPALEVL